jgi:hypothetical protein
MRTPEAWSSTAFNPVPESENRIHSDEARQFGFQGGLVPGVVVSAYLIQPAIEAWGVEWLERGSAEVMVKAPLYDGQHFDVLLEEATDHDYSGRLLNPLGELCASARVELPEHAPPPPVMRGDPRVGRDHQRPLASRPVFEKLREEGLGALHVRCPDAEIASDAKDPSDLPLAFRPDAAGHANPAFVLGMTNWALTENVHMSPWLHMQTEHRNHAVITAGSELILEQSVADLFERKGHEFVDVDVAAFLHDGSAVMSGRLRAIYKLRDSEG